MERLDFMLEDNNLDFDRNSIVASRLGFLNKDGRKVMDVYTDSFYVYDQNFRIDDEVLEIIKLIQTNVQNQIISKF